MPLVHLEEGSQTLVFPSSHDTSSSPHEYDQNDDESSTVNNQSSDELLQKLNVTDGKLSDSEIKLDSGYSCKNCGRFYKLKSSLRNHQKWECGKDPQFSCPYCVYKAKQKMHINRHLERMHKEKITENSNGVGTPVFSLKEEQKLNATL